MTHDQVYLEWHICTLENLGFDDTPDEDEARGFECGWMPQEGFCSIGDTDECVYECPHLDDFLFDLESQEQEKRRERAAENMTPEEYYACYPDELLS